MERLDIPQVQISIDPLVLEILRNREGGLSTNMNYYKVREIEQEIILAALRIQKNSNRW